MATAARGFRINDLQLAKLGGRGRLAELLSIGGGFALLVVVALVSVWLVARNPGYIRWISETRSTQTRLLELLIRVQDAETGQRGLLLTADPAYLEPYQGGRAAAVALLTQLDTDALRDPKLRPGMDRLRRHVGIKLAELDRTIALFQAGSREEAVGLVKSDVGLRAMNDIRSTLDELVEVVGSLVDDRRSALSRNSLILLVVVLIGLALVIVLAASSIVRFRQQMSTIGHARAELQRFNERLEQRVQARTADLREANDEIQRFAYIVSHDLRAPLVNVMGFTSELETLGRTLPDLLPAQDPRSGELRRDLDEAVGFIRAATDRMDRLIAAILTLSRAGRRVFSPEPLDLQQLTQGVVDGLHHRASAAGATVTVEPLPSLTSDRLALEQVLGNLIDNALKYLSHDRPGRIRVTGHEWQGWVELQVEDNGRGVDPRDHERIFELFRRAGVQDQPGDGIGLAHVRALVRRLGGTIHVTSALGTGSVFRIRLPGEWRPPEPVER